ncbi:MAG: YgjV family protein [Clostridia bacterium]|nr:YgjV family protein [Clostridia bacterium]
MEALITLFENLIAEYGVLWLIGQGFGIIAIVLGFVSYQVKTKRSLLFMQGAVAFTFLIHYFLIGAYSGMAMTALNIVRNIVYDARTKKGITSKWIPIAFVAVQAVMCLFTWDGWYSIFILVGICINTYCMSLPNPQTVRKSILITSPMVLVYDIFARSIGGTVYESVALLSAVIGILRNRKRDGKRTAAH